MVKIYTKTGDTGSTSLFGGKRVRKNSARIEAYGCIDELNSLIGVVIVEIGSAHFVILRRKPKNLDPSHKAQDDISKKLLRMQGELFILGTDLATPFEVKVKIPRITKAFVTRLEKEIDVFDKKLPILKNFILPGGGVIGANLHLARTVARRAERSIVTLTKEEKINPFILSYINRLSDWFFVLARYINKVENQKETIWKGRGK